MGLVSMSVQGIPLAPRCIDRRCILLMSINCIKVVHHMRDAQKTTFIALAHCETWVWRIH